MFKRFFSGLLALTLSLCAFPMALSESSPSDWRTLYRNMLAVPAFATTRQAMLADLNLDGMPELILVDENAITMITVVQGQLWAPQTINYGDFTFSKADLTHYAKGAGSRWVLEGSADYAAHTASLVAPIALSGNYFAPKIRFAASVDEKSRPIFWENGRYLTQKAYEKRLNAYRKSLGDKQLVAPSVQAPVLPQFDALCAQYDAQLMPSVAPQKVVLEKSKVKVAPGEMLTLNAHVTPAHSTGGVTWQSSDAQLADVNVLGDVTFTGRSGKVTITCSAGAVSAKRTFTIVPKKPQSVSISGAFEALRVGGTVRLTAEVAPSGALQRVKWVSSNPSVATVDQDGVVTGHAPGTADVTATASKGVYAYAHLVVTQDNATKPTGQIVRRAAILAAGDSDNLVGSSSCSRFLAFNTQNALAQSSFGGTGGIATTLITSSQSGEAALDRLVHALDGADQDDVSYVALITLGLEPTADGTYKILLSDDTQTGFVTSAQLRDALDRVPGTIVLMMSGSYSGAAITKGTAQRFIRAFAGGARPRSGELATEKYRVLCATGKDQNAWGAYDEACQDERLANWYGTDLFLDTLAMGIGWDTQKNAPVAFAADENGDGQVTLAEIGRYTYYGVKRAFYSNYYNINALAYLHEGVPQVQVWPANCADVIFAP
ncbi:MAG: Ig-like domain-containing protein [Clostridia bacterium]